ncbi:MAG: hypothetical protein QXF35_02100 [Candidatus Bilamarchaeaceae archaeon]
MKNEEINLVDEGFEELSNQKNEVADSKQPQQPGAKPDFRVVQPDRDKNGNIVYINVGGMWKNVSKSGNEFYTLRIGQLKLLVFPNNR